MQFWWESNGMIDAVCGLGILEYCVAVKEDFKDISTLLQPGGKTFYENSIQGNQNFENHDEICYRYTPIGKRNEQINSHFKDSCKRSGWRSHVTDKFVEII